MFDFQTKHFDCIVSKHCKIQLLLSKQRWMRHFPVSFSLIVISVLGVYKWRLSSVPSGMVWLSIHSHWGKPHLLSVLPIAGLTSFFSHIGKFLIFPKQSVNPGHNSPLASSIKISANGTHGDTELHTSSLWNSEGSLYTPCPYVKNALFYLCVQAWPEVQWWHSVAWPWPLSQVEVEHGLNSGL